MLDVINLILGLLLLGLIWRNHNKYVTHKDLSATVESVRETVQDIADKTDVDFSLNERCLKTQESSLISVAASLSRLADAVGYELKDGFWVKKTVVKTVAKKETPVAKKATAKKGAK